MLFCNAVGAAAESVLVNNIRTLRTAEIYARGLVGFAGHQLPADIAFERILTAKNAEEIFLETIRSNDSTAAAAAYSFCGLKRLNSAKLSELKTELSKTEFTVSQMHGDIMRKDELSKVIQFIYNNGC